MAPKEDILSIRVNSITNEALDKIVQESGIKKSDIIRLGISEIITNTEDFGNDISRLKQFLEIDQEELRDMYYFKISTYRVRKLRELLHKMAYGVRDKYLIEDCKRFALAKYCDQEDRDFFSNLLLHLKSHDWITIVNIIKANLNIQLITKKERDMLNIIISKRHKNGINTRHTTGNGTK